MTTLATALLGLAGASPALAASGGASAAPSAPAAASPSAPSVTSVACRSGCRTGGAVARGGTITLHGQRLDRATAVVFLGGSGPRDDVRVAIRAKSAARVDVKIPATAKSGRIALASSAGVAAQTSAAPLKVTGAASRQLSTATKPVEPTLKPVKGIAQLDAGIAKRKVGKAGVSAVTIAYVSHAPEQTVRVDVVRRADNLSIFSDERTVSGEEQQTLTWNGRGTSALALDGKYDVRISTGGSPTGPRSAKLDVAAAGGAAPEGTPPPTGSTSLGAFTFVGAVFPVRGTHNFGQSAARFGAGRGGRSHQGQDMMARCGTPVVAARGGVVKMRTFQAAAGNYVVVSDPVTGQDHAYMHFRAPAVVARGDTVETGQLLGYVGPTGSSTACHLHFEIWTAPGWYEGGRPIDPYATLKRWAKLG